MGYGMNYFVYKGEPIADINAWAKSRGEHMVKYKAYRLIPSYYTGKIEREEHTGEMPESFWKGIRMTDGWNYVEIKRKKKSRKK